MKKIRKLFDTRRVVFVLLALLAPLQAGSLFAQTLTFDPSPLLISVDPAFFTGGATLVTNIVATRSGSTVLEKEYGVHFSSVPPNAIEPPSHTLPFMAGSANADLWLVIHTNGMADIAVSDNGYSTNIAVIVYGTNTEYRFDESLYRVFLGTTITGSMIRLGPMSVAQSVTLDNGGSTAFHFSGSSNSVVLNYTDTGALYEEAEFTIFGNAGGTAAFSATLPVGASGDLGANVQVVDFNIYSFDVQPTNITMEVGSLSQMIAFRRTVSPPTSQSNEYFQVSSTHSNIVGLSTNQILMPATPFAVQDISFPLDIYGFGPGTAEVTFSNAAYGAHAIVVNVITSTPKFIAAAPSPVIINLLSNSVQEIEVFSQGLLTQPLTLTLSHSSLDFGVNPTTITYPVTAGIMRTSVVQVTGYSPGSGQITIEATSEPGYAATNVHVFVYTNSPALSLYVQPDPVTINLTNGNMYQATLVRAGTVAGELNSPLTVYMASDNTNVCTVPTTVSFPASGASQQPALFFITGNNPGSANIIMGATNNDGRVYQTVDPAVNVVLDGFTVQIPSNLWVYVGGTRDFRINRVGDTTLPLSTELVADTNYYKVRGDGVGYTWKDDVTIPAGATTAVFSIQGLLETEEITNAWLSASNSLLMSTSAVFVISTCSDTDDDGLPDWWEFEYFGNLDQVADGDPDLDGLQNLYEYYAGTDPTVYDTGSTGLSDSQKDTDADTLLNGDEQNSYLTRPERADTDDDGLNDLVELTDETDPRVSLSPYTKRVLRFDDTGTGQVTVPDPVYCMTNSHLDVNEFTIECWVNPARLPGALARQPLIKRDTGSGINFEMGLENGGKPYVCFESQNAGSKIETIGGSSLRANAWVHLAGRFRDNALTLFVDGIPVRSTNSGLKPAKGVGDMVFGGGPNGFVGDLRDIRIWKIGRTDADIANHRNLSMYWNEEVVNPGVLVLSGDSGHLRENSPDGNDSLRYWTIEGWVKTTAGSEGTIINKWNTTAPGAGDYNYFLRIDDNGHVQAGFGGQFVAYTYEWTGGVYQIKSVESIIDLSSRNHLQGVRRINDGAWHHVAFTRSTTEMALYIDGLLEATQDPYLYPVPGENQMFLGGAPRRLQGPLVVGYELAGQLDEIRVWNYARQIEEIRYDLKHNISGSERGLVSYFNFDNYEGQPVLDRAALYTDPVSTNDDYGILAPSAAINPGRVTPFDEDDVFTLYPFRVLGEIALAAYFSCDDGGVTLEDSIRELNWDYAGVLNPNVAFNLYEGQQPAEDSDGDGLPDWWETAHGLNPRIATGDDGAWGDPDQDGLNNRAEYLADTDPRNFDTDGDGFGDYDSRAAPNARSWGELYSDGDGMDDAWEMLYPTILSPLEYNANQDPDGDGWDNYSEFMSNTDPSDHKAYPVPNGKIIVKYSGLNNQGPIYLRAYDHAGMDGTPIAKGMGGDADFLEEMIPYDAGNSISETISLTPIAAGSVEICVNCVGCSMRFVDNGAGGLQTTTQPTKFGQIDYETGAFSLWTGPIGPNTLCVDYARLGPVSSYPAESPLSSWYNGHLRQTSTWFFAWIDVNDNGMMDHGEPAGVSQSPPAPITWGQNSDIVIGLTDEPKGLCRFSWDAPPISNGVNDVDYYVVTIQNLSLSGGPEILRRTIDDESRTYFHEADYLDEGIFALQNGHYKWRVYYHRHCCDDKLHLLEEGSFVISLPTAQSTPECIDPAGAQVVFARNQFRWKMDETATRFRLQISPDRNFSTIIHESVEMAYFREADGSFQFTPPIYAGDGAFVNRPYYWRVQSRNAYTWSDFGGQAFTLNMYENPQGAYTISGDVLYFGQTGLGNLKIQAYYGRGFGNMPEAQLTKDAAGAFQLMGLRAGTYNVRAFYDQNYNGKPDPWESQGFIKSPTLYAADYEPKQITVPGNVYGEYLIIRDQDTDRDRIPDAWEWHYFGNLTSAFGTGDYDGDGVSDYDEIIIYNTNPNDSSSKPATQPDLVVSPAQLIVYALPNTPVSANISVRNDGHGAVTYSISSDQPWMSATPSTGYSVGQENTHMITFTPQVLGDYTGHIIINAGEAVGMQQSVAVEYRVRNTVPEGQLRVDLSPADAVAKGARWRVGNGAPLMSGSVIDLVEGFYTLSFTDVAGYPTPASRMIQIVEGQLTTSVGRYGARVPLDFDGDGRSDLSVFYPHTGDAACYSRPSAGGSPVVHMWGDVDVPVPADYTGDGVTDMTFYYPAAGMWVVLNGNGTQRASRQFGWGQAIPVPGDYDGDAIEDLAIYWPQKGTWYILQSSLNAVRQVGWGWGVTVPVPGDYDGDGKTDIGVYWHETGMWYILKSSDGSGIAKSWGWREAVPVQGDYDGDGKTDVAVYWPVTGNWYINYSGNNGIGTPNWGWYASIPVPADYDGDGKTDIAVYWPITGNWYIQFSSGGGETANWGWYGTEPTLNQYQINQLMGLYY